MTSRAKIAEAGQACRALEMSRGVVSPAIGFDCQFVEEERNQFRGAVGAVCAEDDQQIDDFTL
jgi:hypothetical protein